MSSNSCLTDAAPPDSRHDASLIHLEDWRRRMIVKADVRAAIALAYELSQQIAQLDLPSAFPAFSQNEPDPDAGPKPAGRDPVPLGLVNDGTHS